MAPAPPRPEQVADDVRRALAEDIGDGDLTAALLPPKQRLDTRVVCREPAVFCGRPWFEETFRQLDDALVVTWATTDGAALAPGDTVCRVAGPAAPLLSGERTALNFIQTLSGTATQTRRYVDELDGTATRLLDTRKTLPGLRLAQKYAVRCGGGDNHRIGLFDAVLIKENHLEAAGGVGPAVAHALQRHPDVLVEVEVENLTQLAEAIDAGAHRALLDNFSLDDLRNAVELARGRLALEASGDITLKGLAEVAATGVDFISTGAITKHVRAIDFSLRFEPATGGD